MSYDRYQPDYDRCGWGTPWGCKEHLPETGPAHLLTHAARPENFMDNGHRMFHLSCFDAIPTRSLVSHG